MEVGIVNGNETPSITSIGDVDHDDSDDEKDEEGGIGGAEHQGGRLIPLMIRFERMLPELRTYSREEKEEEEAEEEERCGS